MQELYATVDLGSNSFHMLTAALEYNEIKPLDSVSEKVMLAEGLSKEKGITPEAQRRGLECIDRFAQRLQSIPKENIRIVGTNTLRAAVNSKAFVNQLEERLGRIPIEVISGIEEARLIYLGVSHTWSSLSQQTNYLVMDIGGGSTEFIIGKKFKLKEAESLRMGCVAYRRFFPQDEINIVHFNRAEKAAEIELVNIVRDFRPEFWTNVVGSAGTFKAIENLCISQGHTQEGITLEALEKIKKQLLEFSTMDEIALDGLKELRKKTIMPGVAIATAIFKLFKIEVMHISRGGLREGILYDLIGRHNAEDIRERSINAISKRYGQHDSRIRLNSSILESLVKNISKDSSIQFTDENKQFMGWASSCSQIGLAISHTQYQNHSAYLIQNSELNGFTLKERALLAAVVRNHRRKIRPYLFEELALQPHLIASMMAIVFIIRLVFIVSQNGKKNRCKDLKLKINNKQMMILFSQKWVDDNRLIYDSIINEQLYWQAAGFELTIVIY